MTDLVRDTFSDKWVLQLVPEIVIWQHRHGIISDRQLRLYKLLWVWCAPHFSNVFGAEDARARYGKKCGREAVDRRQARALKWRERIMSR